MVLKEGEDEGVMVRPRAELKRVWHAGGFSQLNEQMCKANVCYGCGGVEVEVFWEYEGVSVRPRAK